MFYIALTGEEEGEAPSKGLFALPFMQRAVEKRKAAAQAQAQALLQVHPQAPVPHIPSSTYCLFFAAFCALYVNAEKGILAKFRR